LLRHAEAVSSLEDLSTGRFERVFDDPDPAVVAKAVKRIVLCSGKLYYELVAARRARDTLEVALVRIELLYPFPSAALAEVLAGYPEGTEIVWCQEEPKNMGVWPVLPHFWWKGLSDRPVPRYVGRGEAASPATGSHKKHVEEQNTLIDAALTIC
jgi:2-oxoglutarate dehydrogenase E1 component